MCMIDSAEEYWTNFEPPHEVCARKGHVCSNCHRVIEKGERYWKGTWLADYGIETVKYCPHCQIAAGWLTRVCSGFLWGDEAVAMDLQEHWDEEWVFQCRSLALLLAAMHRKWLTKQGDPLSLAKCRSLTTAATAHAVKVMAA
jgi:hypothetical protein